MYSLRFLFFSLPLYFSHVFSPLGVTIGETYAFERYKVYLFLMLIAAAYIEMLIRYPDRILYIFHKYFLHIIILLILPIVSALYFSIPLDIDWLMGSHEKHHGYLFYVGVLLLANLLYMSNREQLRSYIK